MDRKYDFVKDVSPTKQTQKIKIVVIRVWKVARFNNSGAFNSIEVIFVDENVY